MRMRKRMINKLLLGAVVCGLAGMASAINWRPVTTNTPDIGYWNNTNNWEVGVLPGAEEKTQFSSSVLTECIVSNEMGCGQLVLGDGGADDGEVNLRIIDGGILNAGTEGSWVGVGYNRPAHCTVEAGGLLNVNTRIGVGMVLGGLGLLDVYGDVALTGNLQVGTGGDGTVMLYKGGAISAGGLEIGATDALIDIWNDGALTFSGDVSNTVAGAIADGRIIGNRLTNNIVMEFDISEEIVEGVPVMVTNTVVTAIESVPNAYGLNLEETTNFFARFDYVVGTTTVAFVSGALTGHVIGQSPAAGSAALTNGAVIDLVLQATSVPNIVGLSLAEAESTLVLVGLLLGDVTETYIFDVEPDSVLEQTPLSGAPATVGEFVHVVAMEPMAGRTIAKTLSSGDWMIPTNWDTGVIPVRETQNFEVDGPGGFETTLTNFVAVEKMRMGLNGTGTNILNIGAGGHLVVAPNSPDYIEVGANRFAILNVYAGGILECRQALRFAWGNDCIVNIDGGTVSNNNWMSFGNGGTIAEITIKNGGNLTVLRDRGYNDGTITIYDGTYAMLGSGRIAMLQAELDAGDVVIADGYTHTLRVDSVTGNSTIQTYGPGYGTWFAGFEDDLGAMTNDFDEDGVPNLLEYALGGSPTNGVDDTTLELISDGAGSLNYMHAQPTNDTSLVYIIETRDSLTSGAWTNAGNVTVSGTTVTGAAYDYVTNSVPTTDQQKFIRLKVEQ